MDPPTATRLSAQVAPLGIEKSNRLGASQQQHETQDYEQAQQSPHNRQIRSPSHRHSQTSARQQYSPSYQHSYSSSLQPEDAYAYSPSSSSDMFSQSQITPPATPNTGGNGFEPTQRNQQLEDMDVEEDNEDEETEEQQTVQTPVFYNFLRSIFPFTPNPSENESSVTLPLAEGDVIMVHSIHTNGWADGALLSTGARGWLPTNYCEAYEPEEMRSLLAALLNFWDLLRSTSVNDEEIFGNQEFMKGLIAGVRFLLERTDCLTRESLTIKRNEYMRRGRKSLLSELSSLVKTAKKLPECQRGILVPAQDINDIIDEMILKAYKIVLKGVRFLDLYIDDRRHRLPSPVPIVVGGDVNSSFHPSQMQSQHSGYIPPTPPADSTVFDAPVHTSSTGLAAPIRDGGVSLSSRRQSLASFGSQAHQTTVSLPNRRISNLYSPGTGMGRNKAVNNNRLSFAGSMRVHRLSTGISHRMSMAGPSPLSVPQHLVSERLSKSHDTFLSHLGSFIGRLQFQSQSRPELVLSIKQSATSGGGLLAVVDVVCCQTTVSADILTAARESMFERIQELVFAGHDIVKNYVHEEADVVMPQQNGVLIAAATGCVKAAGDCVAKTKWVIERIGDFEFELEEWSLGIDLTVLDVVKEDTTPPVSEAADAGSVISSSVTDSVASEISASKHSTKPSIAASLEKPLPLVPEVEISTPLTTETFLGVNDVDHSLISSISHSRPSSRQATSTPIQETVHGSHSVHSSPRSVRSNRSQKAVEQSKSPKSTKSSRQTLPPLPKISTAVEAEGETLHEETASAVTTEFQTSPTFMSLAASSADSNTTYLSRDSEASMMSRTSTRATTPDGPRNKSSISGLSTNSSFQAESTEAEGDNDELENKLLAKTYAHQLMFNKEGQVTGGTIPALVERLTTHESTPDAMFVSTFYLTFRLFCSPVRLAQTLVDRFDYVTGAPHMAGPVRLRVYNAFKGWMESHWRDQTDREALTVIVPFADVKLSAVLPSAGRRLVELAQRVSNEGSLVPRLVSSMGKTNTAIAAYIPPDTPLPTPNVSRSVINSLNNWKAGGTSPNILDFDPLEFARQLTLKQMTIFSSIMPEELLGSQWMKNQGADAPNVKAMSTLSTDLSNFVAENILGYTEVKKRAAAIKQWIKIAHQLYELNNYDGLMAIICRLNSSTITRLRRTWDIISPKRREMLKTLQAIVEPQHNHKALRSRLHDHVPPCLPFLGMYLTDLTFVDIGNQATKQLYATNPGGEGPNSVPSSPRTDSDNGITLINFDKHMRTAKIIGELQRFQIPYRLTEVPEIQEWIIANLNRVHGNDQGNVQVTYYRQSLMLEPREVAAAIQKQSAADQPPPTPGLTPREGYFPWRSKDRTASIVPSMN